MRARTLARGLLLAGGAFAGLLVLEPSAGAQVVQGQNSSRNATAVSGPAAAANTAVVSSGGTARRAQLIGGSDVAVGQSSAAKSGPAVAGSQVTGVVGGGGGAIQAQNSAFRPVARSGNATAVNVARVAAHAGGARRAQVIGDNFVDVDQRSVAVSGPAVAGSTVAGAVGGGGVIQLQNDSRFAFARSGNAFATNVARVDSDWFWNRHFRHRHRFGHGFQRIGDNAVVVRQESFAFTGPAVAGSQVVGVGGRLGATSLGAPRRASTGVTPALFPGESGPRLPGLATETEQTFGRGGGGQRLPATGANVADLLHAALALIAAGILMTRRSRLLTSVR